MQIVKLAKAKLGGTLVRTGFRLLDVECEATSAPCRCPTPYDEKPDGTPYCPLCLIEVP